MPTGGDLAADPLVVEVEQHLVVNEDVAPPRPVLQFADLVQQRPVGGQELVVGAPFAVDQRVPDEQVAGQFRVDPAEVDRPRGDDGQPEQRDPLRRRSRLPC